MKTKRYQPGNAHLLIMIISVLALISALGFIVWQNFMQSKTAIKKNTNNSTQKTTETLATIGNVLKIPNLGIEIINIPATISDLNYSYSYHSESNLGSAGFGTKQLDTASMNTCTAGNEDIGSLIKRSGVYDNSELVSQSFVKQFTDFFINYQHPQGICNLDNMIGIDATTVTNLRNSQMGTFETLVTNPNNIVAL